MSGPILFLLNSLTIGGSERKIINISNELSEKGWEVHLGYLSRPEALRTEIANKVKVVNFKKKFKFDPFVIKKIYDYISINSVNVLICVNLYPTMYGFFIKKLQNGNSGTCVSFLNKTNIYSRYEKLKMLLYVPILRNVNAIVFGCYFQKRKWVNKYRLDETKCTHIYNGVDCSHFSPKSLQCNRSSLREVYGFSDSDVVIVNVSRFSHKKNQEDLIEACEKLLTLGYPIKLVLVGDGPRRQKLMVRVEKSGFVDNILFLGQMLDVRPILNASDIFVLPSSADTFSNATLEAMAMEKPVILADVAGASEMVMSGKNGFLYPVLEIEKLAEHLKLLVENQSKRLEMGQEGRKIAEKYFEFQGMIKNYETILNAINNSMKFIPEMIYGKNGFKNDDM